jgi:hypothetical protein
MVYGDRRHGGIERWYWGDPREASMRIPDDWMECVCFLCTRQSNGQYHYGGTAFFISVPAEHNPNLEFHYIVTAKHCIEHARQSGSSIFLRLNQPEKAIFVEERDCIRDTWIYSDQADVAVSRFELREGFSVRYVESAGFLTESIIRTYDIGIGDDLYIPGLFRRRVGNARNIPILRSGMIAAMPGEPLRDEATGEPYHAYLAEVHSIGGLSGSPVFVTAISGYRDGRSEDNPSQQMFYTQYEYYLLGLIRGHWDLKEFDHEYEQMNAGIAIVTPIDELRTLLFREDLVKERRKEERERAKEQAPTLDSHLPSETFTKEDFEEALRKVSRRREPPDQQSPS